MSHFTTPLFNVAIKFKVSKIFLVLLVLTSVVTLTCWRLLRPVHANINVSQSGSAPNYVVSFDNDPANATAGSTVTFTGSDASGVLMLGEQGGVLTYSSYAKGDTANVKNRSSAPRTVEGLSLTQVSKIVVNGGSGDDTLVINNPEGSLLGSNAVIEFNGGEGFDTLVLQGGGGPDAQVTYTPGPTNDAGLIETTLGSARQVIRFTGLEPVQDNVPAATLAVNANPADNAINYVQGSGGGIFVGNTGLITVDNTESFEFNNKTNLVINGLAGSDTININNQTTPAGLTGSITVDGGDPTAGSDTLIVNGRVNSTDAITYTPATTTSDTGSVAITGLPTVNFTATEHLVINGQNGGPGSLGDSLTINTGNLSSGQAEILTPGSQFDSGHVDFRDRPGGANPAAVPLDFSKLGVAGSLSFADIGRFDNLIYNGTALNDTFTVNASGVVTLNDQIPVSTSSIITLTLAGLDGNNTFNVAGNQNLPGGVLVQGGAPAANVLNFTGNGAGAVTIDLAAPAITEAGFSSVGFTNCVISNVNAGGAATTVNGTAGPDSLSYTPTATAAGTVTSAGLNTSFNINNINGAFTIDPLAGSDTVTVNGTAGNDTITAVRSGTNTTVQVNALQAVTLPSGNTEALVISGGPGNDTLVVNANGSTNPVAIPITYDGGTGINALNLLGTGTADLYTPGPQLGAGTSTVVFAGGTQLVTFLNLAPIFDSVVSPLVVDGTNNDDSINYTAGFNSLANFIAGTTDPAWGEVSVGGYEPMEFSNKTALTINALGGSDTINLNNPNTPTGLLGNITVNGGDPTASDTLIVNGRVNATDTFTYTPATSTSDTGSVSNTGLPSVNFTTIEHLVINGQNGGPGGSGDSLTINTSNLSSGQTEVLTPGSTFDSGHVDFRDRPGGVNPTAVPVDFKALGVAGSLSFNDIGRFDNLIYNGTQLNDTFSVSTAGVVVLNDQIPVNTSSIRTLTLAGLDGNNTFNIPSNHNLPGNGGTPGIFAQGGDGSGDVLNFTSTADAATTVDLGAATVGVTGFGAVGFGAVEIINEISSGSTPSLTVNGTSGGDNITFTPTGANAGTVMLAGLNPVVKFTGVPALTLLGSDGNDFFDITPSSTVSLNIFGGNPTPPASPGDTLSVNLAGTTGASQNNSTNASGLSGFFTFSNRQTVQFQEIETLSPLTVTGHTFNAVEGIAFSNVVVGSFNAGAINANNFTATINWGDGSASSAGVIIAGATGAFNVLGGHTYVEEGSYNVTIQVTDTTTGTTQQATSRALVADAPLSIVAQAPGASTTFTGSGGNNVAGGAFNAFNAYKAAIGGVDNGGTASPQNGGFRTINWDGVGLTATDGPPANPFTNQVIVPNHVVGIPLNRFQERGMNFSEIYAVSDDGFTSVNPNVAGQFPAFSPTKTFAMFNDNTIGFNFVLPSVHHTTVPIQAVSRGFGAIFLDVENANTTSIEYFNGTTSLGKFFVPTGASGQPEFFGVLFQNAVVTNVEITLGNATLFSFDGTNVTSGPVDAPPGTDLAVTDDFVYPEPQAVSTGININATAGTPFTAKVASFFDADPNGQASDYSVVIDWGDGTTSAGGVTPNAAHPDDGTLPELTVSVTPNVSGGFDVTGTHTYTATGVYNIVVAIRDTGGASIAALSTAVVGGTSQNGSMQFNAATTSVLESAGTVSLTVTRTGDTTQPSSVNFETSDGTAVQKSDYTFNSGTVQFAPGDTSKTITISIVNDDLVEGSQTFFVNLSNPSFNYVVGSPGSIAVTILDDDTVAPTTNPIDDPTFFVRQQYLDFLGREPDAPGLSFWVGQITACGANPACINAARVNVSGAFFLSIEYQETSGAVVRTQRVAFGHQSNDPSTRVSYLQFMRDTRQIGAGVIVGQPGFDTLLEQNKQAYATQIVNSAAFLARFPIIPAASYVDALAASAAVTLTAAERTAAINAFGAGGTLGRVAALRSIADSNTLRQVEFAPSFVLAEYFGYLRRNPTDPPDNNDAGYQFWLAKLNSFNGDFTQAEMVKAFIASSEYRQRFGP